MDRLVWEKWKEERHAESGNQLVQNYLPLVNYVVQQMALKVPPSVTRDDLTSYGFDGLLDALEKYDFNREIKFETYASLRIKGAILDALRKTDSVSRTLKSKVKKIDQAYAFLEQQTQRSVSSEEVARHLDIDEKQLNDFIGSYEQTKTTSIDEVVSDEESSGTSLQHFIQDFSEKSPLAHVEEGIIKQTIAENVSALPEKEKLVVALYYYEELKFSEIAKVLDVSVPRVSQLHARAISRLKQSLQKFEFLSV